MNKHELRLTINKHSQIRWKGWTSKLAMSVLMMVMTRLWGDRSPWPLHLSSHSRMNSWKPFRKVCKCHTGPRSNKVKHTHYTVPVTSSQKYQRNRVRRAPASSKLVDGVTVWLNYPLLDQRPACCENTEQGFQPFLICTLETTLHSVLGLFSEDKWSHYVTLQSSAFQENYQCMGVSRI